MDDAAEFGACAIRGGAEEMKKLAVAAVTLQSKLLRKPCRFSQTGKKLTWYPLSKLKNERKISKVLGWKLLTPSHKWFFLRLLDAMCRSNCLPRWNCWRASSRQTYWRILPHELLLNSPETFDLVNGGLCDWNRVGRFLRFPLPNGEKFAADFKMVKSYRKSTERIERAIETIVSKW